MISGTPLLLNYLGYAVAFAVTLGSGYYTYRQRLTNYQIIRDSLVLVYIAIMALMVLDLARIVTGSLLLATVYPVVSISLALFQATVLLSAAVGIYLRPSGSSYRALLEDIRARPAHMETVILFTAMAIAIVAYVSVFAPYRIVQVADVAGGTVYAASYDLGYSVAVGVLFVFFLGYPITLLVRGGLKAPSRALKWAQVGLAAGWGGCATIYFASSVLLYNYSLDVTPIAYVVLSVVFGYFTRNFRNAAVLSGFVQTAETARRATPWPPAAPAAPDPPGDPQPEAPAGTPGQRPPLSIPLAQVEGKMSLVEVDTASKYEDVVLDMATSLKGSGLAVFAVTTKGSRLHSTLIPAGVANIYTMSAGSSYLTSSTRSDEVLIPLYDPAVLLGVLDKTLTTSSGSVALFFDSISDMVVYAGFENCYKFLKQASEIIAERKGTAFFLLFTGAHEETASRTLRSIFPAQFAITQSSLKVLR